MKNGIVNIGTFKILHETFLTLRTDQKYGDWASASGLPQARISELKKMLKDGASSQHSVGRACTPDKIFALLDGLKKLFGGTMTENELLKRLKSAKTKEEENLIMLMLLNSSSQEDLNDILRGLLKKQQITE